MTSAQQSDKWTGIGLTDRGRIRKLNQDAFSLDNTLQSWILADGMGGHAGGEVASQIAVKTIPDVVRTQLSTETSPYIQPDKLESLLGQALESANQLIRKAAAADEYLKGMGTTIIVVAITRSPTGYQASVAHAGDSRAYLFRQGTLSLWTKDHTLMEERLALNLITAEQVRSHPLRHVLTKALGIDPETQPTFGPTRLSHQITFCCVQTDSPRC